MEGDGPGYAANGFGKMAMGSRTVVWGKESTETESSSRKEERLHILDDVDNLLEDIEEPPAAVRFRDRRFVEGVDLGYTPVVVVFVVVVVYQTDFKKERVNFVAGPQGRRRLRGQTGWTSGTWLPRQSFPLLSNAF